MFTVFSSFNKVEHLEFLLQGQRVNHEYHKRLDMWRNNEWFIHYDNASFHSTLPIYQFSTKSQMTVFSQAPHSPELSPTDFVLSPQLKTALKRRHFYTIDDIKTTSSR